MEGWVTTTTTGVGTTTRFLTLSNKFTTTNRPDVPSHAVINAL